MMAIRVNMDPLKERVLLNSSEHSVISAQVLDSVQRISFSGSEQTTCNAFFQRGGKDRIRYCRRINACNENVEDLSGECREAEGKPAEG
ncbi:hypothetical protein SUGI_1125640 [Cryptomeria japonica]|nr:hypothetical protein SUGI_1125640 [Cryptomeria japonica]